MAYNPTIYANDSAPAVSAENLNKSENELKYLDDTATELIVASIWESTQGGSYSNIEGSYVNSTSRNFASASGYHRTNVILVPEGYNKVRLNYTYNNQYVETLYFSTRTDGVLPSAASQTKITSVTSGTEYDIPTGTKSIILSASSSTNFGTVTFILRKSAKEKVNVLESQMATAESNISSLQTTSDKVTSAIALSESTLNPSSWTQGYVKTDGSGINTSAGWKYTNFIDVSDCYEIVPNFTYSNSYMAVVSFFTQNNVNIQSFILGINATSNTAITVPSNAKYCVLSVTDTISQTATLTGRKTEIKTISLKDYVYDKTCESLENFFSILDFATLLKGQSVNGETGVISASGAYSSYVLDISELDRTLANALVVDVQSYGNAREGCAFYKYVNNVRTYISGKAASQNKVIETYVLDIPSDATEFIFSFANKSSGGLTIQNPQLLLYVPNYIDKLIKKVDTIDSGLDIDINLPDKYEAAIGDKLELFYSGMIDCKNTEDFYIELDCSQSKGKTYDRKWEYEAVSGDTDFTMKVIVYRIDGEKVKENTTSINVVSKPVSVSANNVCCVGDSLTVNGTWCGELKRRLTGSGGTPEGDGYSNISFVGTMGTSVKFEGRGGWTWTSYCSSGEVMYWVDVVSGQKTDAMHESVWNDGTNNWILETIEEGKLKFKRYNSSGTYTMASSGTLTYVSGGGSETGDIVYENATAEAGNPFYNANTNQLDFENYCDNLGIDGIDTMIILLGWNSILNGNVDINITRGKEFIDALHSDYPNCKVIICGLQVPSVNGWATNYGTYKSGNYTKDYLTIKHCMFQLNDAYQSWCNEVGYSDFMDFVQISGQFDMEYGYPTSVLPANQRTSETVTIQTNCVHPSTNGQYMIADAVYRKMIALLGE